MPDLTPEIHKVPANWRTLLRLLTFYHWRCFYTGCRAPNSTSLLLWNTAKYALICEVCKRQQPYPGYIGPQDPERQ